MFGPNIDILPDNSQYAGLVEKYIYCLLIYWNNCDSLLIFCDNYPLYFKANIFLEKIIFKEGEKTNLRTVRNDEGNQNLERDELFNDTNKS